MSELQAVIPYSSFDLAAGTHRIGYEIRVLHKGEVVLAQANNGRQAGQYAWSWRAEMLAVLGGGVIAVVLLCLGRFGEATFVGRWATRPSAWPRPSRGPRPGCRSPSHNQRWRFRRL